MNHRIFERKLRSLDIQGACLSERRLTIYTHFCVERPIMHLFVCQSMDLNRVVRLCVLLGRLNLLLSFSSGVALYVLRVPLRTLVVEKFYF